MVERTEASPSRSCLVPHPLRVGASHAMIAGLMRETCIVDTGCGEDAMFDALERSGMSESPEPTTSSLTNAAARYV